jgi:hypothetical protein
MGAPQSRRSAHPLLLAAILLAAAGSTVAQLAPSASHSAAQTPVDAAQTTAQNDAGFHNQPSRSDYTKGASYKPLHTSSYELPDNDSDGDRDEGIWPLLAPPAACPDWAACPTPGEVPVQPAYPSDGEQQPANVRGPVLVWLASRAVLAQACVQPPCNHHTLFVWSAPGDCTPGFGFVKARKHSYDDSYYSYRETKGTCLPCKVRGLTWAARR